MTAIRFSLLIVGLLVATNSIGFIYSLIVIYTPLMNRLRFRKKGTEKGFFGNECPYTV
jgi:hypothetical protein